MMNKLLTLAAVIMAVADAKPAKTPTAFTTSTFSLAGNPANSHFITLKEGTRSATAASSGSTSSSSTRTEFRDGGSIRLGGANNFRILNGGGSFKTGESVNIGGRTYRIIDGGSRSSLNSLNLNTISESELRALLAAGGSSSSQTFSLGGAGGSSSSQTFTLGGTGGSTSSFSLGGQESGSSVFRLVNEGGSSGSSFRLVGGEGSSGSTFRLVQEGGSSGSNLRLVGGDGSTIRLGEGDQKIRIIRVQSQPRTTTTIRKFVTIPEQSSQVIRLVAPGQGQSASFGSFVGEGSSGRETAFATGQTSFISNAAAAAASQGSSFSQSQGGGSFSLFGVDSGSDSREGSGSLGLPGAVDSDSQSGEAVITIQPVVSPPSSSSESAEGSGYAPPRQPSYEPPKKGPEMPYDFGWEVRDDYSKVYKTRQETQTGDSLTGSYSWILPTGKLLVVDYADHGDGFIANVRKESQNIIKNFDSKSSYGKPAPSYSAPSSNEGRY